MEIIKKVVELAKNEVGYKEKETNSNLDRKTANAGDNNFTKYARDLDKVDYFNGNKNGYAWCACFFNWLLNQVYGRDKALEITAQPNKDSCGADCNYAMNYYKANGQFYAMPQVGDQIIFKNSKGVGYHTGIVIGVNGTTVTTIEGNTSNGSGVVDNGGMVCQKSYSLNHSSIAGYGRPKYFEVKEVVEEGDDEVVESKVYTVNGKETKIDTIEKDGKNYVEVRGISEAVGVDVGYDANTKKVTLNTSVDTTKMKINGVLKDVKRILLSDTNFVKLRDLEDNKIKVSYDSKENVATVDVVK